jgi:uncharacterized protein
MRIWQRVSERLAFWIVHRRWRVFSAVVAVIVAGIAIVQSRQNFDSEVLNLLPSDTPAVDALKTVNSKFTQARELTFALRGDPEQVANFGEHFVAALRKEPWVVRVLGGSPMESEDAVESLQPVIPALLLNLDDAQFDEALTSLTPEAMRARLQRLKADLEAGSPKAEFQLKSDPIGIVGKALQPLASLSNGGNRTGLESEDGTMRLIPVVTNQPTLSQPDCAALMAQVEGFKQRVLESWSAPAPEILVTGRSPFVAQIAGSMQRDISVTSTISILAVTGLFYFGFRRLIPLTGIIFILTLSCFASFALGSLFFDKLNLVAIAFCSILVGLGDDFSLLLYNRYLRARNQAEDHEKAIATSIREVSKGIIFVALTTGAGFLTLAGSSSQGFSQLGILIAIGIVLCGLFMITLLFLFIPRNTTMGTRDRSRAILGPVVAKMKTLRGPLGITALLVFGLVVGYAWAPIQALQFDTNPRSLEPKAIPASIALRAIGEKFPSAKDPLFVLVEAKDAEEAHARWAKLNRRLQEMLDAGMLKSFATPAGMQFSPNRARGHQAAMAAVNWPERRAAFLKAAEAEGFNVAGVRFPASREHRESGGVDRYPPNASAVVELVVSDQFRRRAGSADHSSAFEPRHAAERSGRDRALRETIARGGPRRAGHGLRLCAAGAGAVGAAGGGDLQHRDQRPDRHHACARLSQLAPVADAHLEFGLRDQPHGHRAKTHRRADQSAQRARVSAHSRSRRGLRHAHPHGRP